MTRIGTAWGAGVVAAAVLLSAHPAATLRAQRTQTAPRATPALTAAVAAPDDSIRDFARLVAQLSEPGGYFDTDNLISNESSYLHVMGALDRLNVRGGAYVGVGPDQNFSYIARIRPRIAIIIDIRRDNMLQHLLFKALFARAPNRAAYLALLLGRPAPTAASQPASQSVEMLVAYVDSLRATPASKRQARDAVRETVTTFGVPLTAADLATIDRFHLEFIDAGLALRFTSTGRAPQPYYPTLRQLILERDLRKQAASYLARETDFQFVKLMQQRNLIIPVVGDLGGSVAMPAISRLLRQRGDTLSALYASNAEDYVMRGGGFAQYARSVLSFPRDARSVFIRSYFGGGSHPENQVGYYSTQLLQKMDDFATDMAGRGYASYRDLAGRPSR